MLSFYQGMARIAYSISIFKPINRLRNHIIHNNNVSTNCV